MSKKERIVKLGRATARFKSEVQQAGNLTTECKQMKYDRKKELEKEKKSMEELKEKWASPRK
ncbi:MAG TPA: hypothetical protein VH500_25965 [Nitrososphaeraceae archaeon]|jgi:hypothetical protein